jgi:hypothetical protein
MKAIIIILVLLITKAIYCQDSEPDQFQFQWGVNGPLTYLSSDSAYFTQNKFLIGWHWGGPRKISQALLSSQNDATRGIDTSKLVNNCDVILKPEEYSHAVGPEILNARAIQYEPTLLLDPNEPEKLVIRLLLYSHFRKRHCQY